LTEYPESLPKDDQLETLFHRMPPMPQVLAEEVLRVVVEVYGPERMQIEMRNRKIMIEYDGRNISRLCRKYSISRRNFYYIMHKELKRLRKKCNAEVE
jgi:hypothetical protein